jgi:hypothetical protein
MTAKMKDADSNRGDELRGLSPHIDRCDADGVPVAHDSEFAARAIVRLNHERGRLASFEIELRSAALASTAGSIDRDLVHALRGTLNAIVLQVESIKEDLERDGDELLGEIEKFERELARSRQSLTHLLTASVASTPNPEALG